MSFGSYQFLVLGAVSKAPSRGVGHVANAKQLD